MTNDDNATTQGQEDLAELVRRRKEISDLAGELVFKTAALTEWINLRFSRAAEK